jgi:hypothetical protein
MSLDVTPRPPTQRGQSTRGSDSRPDRSPPCCCDWLTVTRIRSGEARHGAHGPPMLDDRSAESRRGDS